MMDVDQRWLLGLPNAPSVAWGGSRRPLLTLKSLFSGSLEETVGLGSSQDAPGESKPRHGLSGSLVRRQGRHPGA